MKKFILLFSLFYINITCFAQPLIEWQICYGTPEPEGAQCLISTNDGGYIMAATNSFNDGRNYWILKLDSVGTIQWERFYGGTDLDSPRSMQQTNDGGYIIAGISKSEDGDVSGHHGSIYYDYWIVKIDSVGTLQWEKSFGGSIDDYVKCVKQTNDNGYIIAGYTRSLDGDITGHHGNSTTDDGWVIKLDSTGNLEWEKSFGTSSFEYIYSVELTDDGKYIIVGSSSFGTGNHGGSDFWVLKLNADGTILWNKSYGGSNSDAARVILKTTDGGYVIAGYSRSADGEVTGNTSGSKDYWVVKIDTAGTIQWQNTYGGSGDEEPTTIEQTSDGGYIVSGTSESNDGDVTGHHGELLEADYWIVKINSTGNLQWQKSMGSMWYDVPCAATEAADGGYMVAGPASGGGDVIGNHGTGVSGDCWLVKLESVTKIISGTVFNDDNQNCTPDSSEILLSDRIIRALPGPYYGYTNDMGNYSLWVPSGTYNISLVPKTYWTQNCPFGNNGYTVTLSPQVSVSTENNFSSYISTFCPDIRIGIGSSSQRRCFSNNYYTVNVCNEGTAVASDATISIQFPDEIIPLSSEIPWLPGTNGEYLFNIGNLIPGECMQFRIRDSISCDAILGSTVCVHADVVMIPQAADCNPSDNDTRDCNVLAGSYDPNSKQVASQRFETRGYVLNENIFISDTLCYLIRFQNTGNDTAFNVTIRDTLSQWLDPITVVTDLASHPYQFSISGTGILEWKFNNILLPDSFVDEPASHGFIKFHVLLKDNLTENTMIKNSADIYFDFNAPVITNNTISTVGATGIKDLTYSSGINSYPNPVSGILTIESIIHKGIFQFHDLSGKMLLSGILTSEKFNIDLTTFTSGIYFITVSDNDGQVRGKIIKQ